MFCNGESPRFCNRVSLLQESRRFQKQQRSTGRRLPTVTATASDIHVLQLSLGAALQFIQISVHCTEALTFSREVSRNFFSARQACFQCVTRRPQGRRCGHGPRSRIYVRTGRTRRSGPARGRAAPAARKRSTVCGKKHQKLYFGPNQFSLAIKMDVSL